MTNEVIKANGADVWKKVMSTALAVPGVKVDRNKFLRNELANWCDKGQIEEVVSTYPHHVLSRKIIDRVAKSCIKSHLYKVVATSAVAGLPGGWGLLATVPADVAQYYWHVFVLSQKLAYLYGWPDLCDEDGNLTDTACEMLTVFVGIMMGVAAANTAIREVVKGFAGQVVKRLPRMALTKGAVYPLIKQIAKWVGINLTKPLFAKSLGKVIPVLGAGISGTITYVTFSKESKRLQRNLKENMQLIIDAQKGANG